MKRISKLIAVLGATVALSLLASGTSFAGSSYAFSFSYGGGYAPYYYSPYAYAPYYGYYAPPVYYYPPPVIGFGFSYVPRPYYHYGGYYHGGYYRGGYGHYRGGYYGGHYRRW